MLNLFYQEPDPDRLIPFDRFPRRVVRRLIRGRPNPGGHARVCLNLRHGLDRLGVRYRLNDYAHARRHTSDPVCIVGKPYLLDSVRWQNPIAFGAAVFAHPVDDPDLLRRLPVTKILVPGEWMRQMFEPYYGDKVVAWPVGIDTDRWAPVPGDRNIDVLLYDKVRWQRDRYEPALIAPLVEQLGRRQLRVETIRYGHYLEHEYFDLVRRAKSMIFLCEHETQGLAYQQALSCDVPVYAWNRGGFWQDPSYFPSRVRFGPVSSIPYWDDRCGSDFVDLAQFDREFDRFWDGVLNRRFEPRRFILDHLTLERCALQYLSHVEA
jgi:glycosyltransferase involved in cell wall biosynthesis